MLIADLAQQFIISTGSFHEFLPTIDPLTSEGDVTFDVVIPSLPGTTFTSSPPLGWSAANDTARLFNTLMVDVLGFDKYMVFGTDLVRRHCCSLPSH